MCRIAVLALMLVKLTRSSPPPLRTTVDCAFDEDPALRSNPTSSELSNGNSRYEVDSFCGMIRRAIPETVRDGRFIIGPDVSSSSDTINPIAKPPPGGFIPKMGIPRIKPPRLSLPPLKVPKLKHLHGHMKTPRVGTPMLLIPWRRDDESSAEKMERFKKGVQKMLHFVKVIDNGSIGCDIPSPSKRELERVHFDERINNNPAESTTKYNTTIDAVFSRHLNKIESQTYVSYFSYYKPIITKIEPTD